jgi:hypothetical protein
LFTLSGASILGHNGLSPIQSPVESSPAREYSI